MKKLMESKGVTIEELAKRSGISTAQLRAYEKHPGDIMKEDVGVAVDICNALSVGMEEFISYITEE